MNKIKKKGMCYLKSMRFQEVSLFLGAPFLGFLFGLSEINGTIVKQILLLLLAVLCVGGAVMLYNDLWGFTADQKDPKRQSPLLSGEASPSELKRLAFVLLSGGFLTCFFFPIRTFFIAAITVMLLILYSHPRFFIKGKPGYSSLLHLMVGSCFFGVGYSVIKPMDRISILIGLYFGIVFMAGHLNHEIKDFLGDNKAGIDTNAIRFGRRKMFILSFIMFSLSTLYLLSLGWGQVIPLKISLIPFSIYPFYVLCFYRAYKRRLDFYNICRFRRQYRILYGIIGFSMVFCLFQSFIGGSTP